jgi:hypothetical protein
MLSAQVGVIPGVVGQQWNGIAVTCHFATIYYIFAEQFNRAPETADYAHLGNLNNVMKKIAGMGVQVSNPGAGALVFAPGTVVVFMEDQQAAHSCVAKQINLLGGYNQANWFTGAGVAHGYTTHNTNQITWRASVFHKNQVRGNVGQWCKLVKVPENSAKEKLRQLVMAR